MSDFVQQQGTVCEFGSSDSWVILSPIELSIKRKIEAVGTPLKDWDVNIYRGVLTGCNEAFIISTEKRNEILSNCKDDDERTRTEALIRPILRGRDIKRYSYEWANLWLIATFPSRHYDIEKYPAVKAHLESYYGGNGRKVLEQTGTTHIINGEKVKSRKKTNNKWFEIQDSINYWEDFSQPKVIYPETTQGAYFAYDESGVFIDKTCFMMVGNDCKSIQQILSSKLFEFAYKRIFSSVELGEHGYQYNKHALEKLPICSMPNIDNISDEMIYSIYGLSDDDIQFIDSQ